ncbi:MAG: imidazole glycerol phosphate synthase subunit HisH [Pyrinomonadaceae bacterium]
MNVSIVKYNAGNTASVTNALRRLGVEPVITDKAGILRSADRVIFPGVGEASTAMTFLRERGLDALIKSLTQPVLGICLGMQLMCETSDENDTTCLGIFPYRVRRFSGDGLKVPHIGWNTIVDLDSPLFSGVTENSHVYFVHGYFVESGDAATASSFYGEVFSAAMAHRNFHALQFHPENSGSTGETILRNFLNL